MPFRIFIIITIFFIISNCSSELVVNKKINSTIEKKFINKGFTLVYNDKLKNEKILNKKLDDRSLLIFHNKLKKNSTVKVRNMKNNKIVLAKVISNSSYPSFYNSVISTRIANEINLDLNEPYVEITLVPNNSSFIAKKAKTFDEEKKVANKAPVDGIVVNDLNLSSKKKKKIKKKLFLYYLKIADFYYYNSALMMQNRIKNEINNHNAKIKKLSETKYRVYLGPFNDIISLQDTFNNIYKIGFENLQIIKND